jgi:hypothetical protein
LQERLHEDRATGSSAWIEETYAEDFSGLLRLGERNSKQNDSKPQADNNTSNHLFPSLILPTAFCSLLPVIR